MAKKKLSKADEFYIKQNPEGLSAEDLAKELNVEQSLVTAIYTVPVKPPRQETLMEKMIGKRTDSAGNVLATVLTGGAEKLSEDFKKERRGLPKNADSYIHKPRG
jgi:hypothetical protein